jgi:hypothetical protein
MAVFLPHFSKTACSIVFGFGLCVASFAASEYRGVIDGPDACANVRAEKRSDALVVAKVKTGEPFTFESKRPVPPDDVNGTPPWERKGDEWCKVTLASKKVGWMQCSCIRLLFTKKDWPHGTPSEIAPTYGQEYYKVMRRAEEGDRDALKKFFAFGKGLDGAGAENHDGVILRVVHILGDARLADFLRDKSPSNQAEIGIAFVENLPDFGAPLDSVEYLRRHFPKASAIFFGSEIVDWLSPDGRYAIRKTFSNPFNLLDSKVTRAEVIGKQTGATVGDLTSDDIGIGDNRWGEVLWSPDSKHFAFLAKNLIENRDVVYRLSGNSFVRVDLPALFNKVAKSATAPVIKDAVFVGEYDEEPRWIKSNVFAMRKNYMYDPTNKPAVFSNRIEKRYEVSATIEEDGKVTTETRTLKSGRAILSHNRQFSVPP